MQMPETLEQRRLFAVTATFTAGVLNVYGDLDANTIRVYKSGSDLVVKGYDTGLLVPLGELLRVADSSVNQIRIYGSGGNDNIHVAAEVVDPLTAYGSTGADTIQAGNGPSKLWGHAIATGGLTIEDDDAADVLIGGASNDELHGQGGNDRLQTSPDVAIAQTGWDTLYGEQGHDVIIVNGAGGIAEMYAGAGNDTFRPDYAAAGHWAIFHGGDGRDGVDYSGWQARVYAQPDGITYSGLHQGTRTHLLGADVENLTGSNYNDELVDGPADNTYYGRGGNDLLWNCPGGSVPASSLGDDSFYGGSGGDTIYGGKGDDDLYGESGGDWIMGDPGDDYIVGGSGSDQMYGMAGSDTIDARDGTVDNDWLVGGWTNGSEAYDDPADHDICYVDQDFVVTATSLVNKTDDYGQFEEIHWN